MQFRRPSVILPQCLIPLIFFQAKHFNGKRWGKQGPKLMTSVVREICSVKSATNNSFTEWNCPGFQVLPAKTGYPIHFKHWLKLYASDQYLDVEASIRDSFVLHYWSSMDRLKKQKPRKMLADMPIYRIFATNCPLTERVKMRELLGSIF